MKQFDELSLLEIVDEVKDGDLIGIPADYSGVPMEFTKELIKKGVKDLKLYCLPLTTIQGDMLIGSGCVSEVEAAAVTLGEFGLAPRFSEAVESGKIIIKDSTCPALHAQLQATEKSVPFMPLRGIIGSDIQKYRKDWQVIENPMKFSGNKNTEKKYYKHTGHPGGIKEISPDKLKEKNKSEDIIKKAIKGMLPNSPLFRDLMKNNLKLYKDSNHPHESQNPKTIDFKSQNRKNLINV